MRYHMKETEVFYKEKNETFEAFFTRIINQLVTFNRLVNETRIHIDFNDNTKYSNWLAVDYIDLSNE